MLDNIEFVLVRPVFLGNIGACARVLKNFGFHHLSLVSPPKNYKDAEARKMSVGAFDVLKQASVHNCLDDALKDVSFAVATSSGQQRQRPLASLGDPHVKQEIARISGKQRVAIVFGDERNGLTNEEVERCHEVIAIPCNKDFPSLNVSHALAVIAYELTLERHHEAFNLKTKEGEELATGQQDDELFGILNELFETIEFSRTFNKGLVSRQLRTAYQRMRPTAREAKLLTGVVHRLNQKFKEQAANFP